MKLLPRRSGGRFPVRTVGIGVLLLAVLALVAVYQKERIATVLSPGTTVSAHFDRMYKLNPYRNDVKLAGVVVGTVTGEEYDKDSATSAVSMKLDPGVADKLGDTPSAHIRPTLLLGGKYYVELVPGGTGEYDDEDIPVERTSVPVELDRVLSSLDKDARSGLQGTVAKTDDFLAADGRDALRDLLDSAPAALGPAGAVLDAARGTQPDQDLTATVTGFQHLAAALTAEDGRVGRITESLAATSAALGDSAPALRDTAATAPETLRTTRAGLADLQPTLHKLTETAPAFRPSAQELGPLLDELDPVIGRTNALVADLRPLLADLRPTVDSLVPTADDTTAVLADLRGPVLDRINGPIRDRVFSQFHGTGAFEGGGANGNLLYEELGFLASHLTSTFSTWDPNGANARLTAGAGGNALGGSAFPPSLEQAQEGLGLAQPPGPQGNDPLTIPGPPAEAPRGDQAPAPAAQGGLVPDLLGTNGGQR